MPTYEYQCEKCDHRFDLFQPITDKSLTVCPKDSCGMKKWGKGRVKRVIGAGGGLIFKGSGFYITDYRSDNYKAGAKKESGATSSEAKPAASQSAATDPKPKKAETKPTKPSGKD